MLKSMSSQLCPVFLKCQTGVAEDSRKPSMFLEQKSTLEATGLCNIWHLQKPYFEMDKGSLVPRLCEDG